MFAAVKPQLSPLDVPTLAFVAVCIAALLGLFLIFAWLQQRNVRALAWWGSAYLIGAASIALWSAPAPLYLLPPEFPEALAFVACGMIWNGIRLFHGRRLLPLAAFAGALVWLILCQFPAVSAGSNARGHGGKLAQDQPYEGAGKRGERQQPPPMEQPDPVPYHTAGHEGQRFRKFRRQQVERCWRAPQRDRRCADQVGRTPPGERAHIPLLQPGEDQE